jgi:hypothetical protein
VIFPIRFVIVEWLLVNAALALPVLIAKPTSVLLQAVASMAAAQLDIWGLLVHFRWYLTRLVSAKLGGLVQLVKHP